MTSDSEFGGRLRLLLLDADSEPGIGSACPRPETLYEAATGALPRDRTLEVVDHLDDCPSCAEAWSLAIHTVRNRPANTAWFGAERVRFWISRVGVAAALLFVGVLVTRFAFRNEPVPTYRADPGNVVRSVLPRDQPVRREDCVLRWSSGPEGALYDVLVTTEDLQTLATAEEIEATEYRVPQEKLVLVPSGGRILWQVTVLRGDGGRAPSKTFVAVLN